jgi:predicted aldo/keto reductase-like oxidoreductase
MATITLNNGLKMPIIGLGVWRIEGQEIKDLILNSIKIGYRHFDCAGTNFSITPSNLEIYFIFHPINKI